VRRIIVTKKMLRYLFDKECFMYKLAIKAKPKKRPKK